MTGTRDLAETAYVLWALASAACARLPATETNAAPTSQAVSSAVAVTSTPNPPTLRGRFRDTLDASRISGTIPRRAAAHPWELVAGFKIPLILDLDRG